jgi:hypothetical protein
MENRMYALVKDGIVINVVMWDGNTDAGQPPEGSNAGEVTEATGPAYIGGKFAALPASTTN